MTLRWENSRYVVLIASWTVCTLLCVWLVVALGVTKGRQRLPSFVNMHEKEIEIRVRERILNSPHLFVAVQQPTLEGDVSRSEYSINDRSRIERFAKLFRVEEKVGRSPPIGGSFYFHVACDETFGFRVVGNRVYLPLENKQLGSLVVRVDWSVAEEIGAEFGAQELVDYWHENVIDDEK